MWIGMQIETVLITPTLVFQTSWEWQFCTCNWAGMWLIKFEKHGAPIQDCLGVSLFSHIKDEFLSLHWAEASHSCILKGYEGSYLFHSLLSHSHPFYSRVSQSNSDCILPLFFCDPINAFHSYAIVPWPLVVAYRVLIFVVSCKLANLDWRAKPDQEHLWRWLGWMRIGPQCAFPVDAWMLI